MCLPLDAFLQQLPSYLGFSYLGRGVSLQVCSSKAQPLLLTLEKGYLLTTAIPDLQRRIAPLGPLCLGSHQSSGCSSLPPALASGVGGSSQLPPLTSGLGWLLRVSARGLRREAASPGHPCPRMWVSPPGLKCRLWRAGTIKHSLKELPYIQGQGQRLRGATLRPRSGVAPGRKHPTSEVRGSGREEQLCQFFKNGRRQAE